jgi:TatD DNase family protein
MLIDTHSHLNFSAFKNDREEVIKRCSDAEVGIVNVGSQYSTSKRAVEIAEKYGEGIWAAIGIHPAHLFGESFEVKKEGIKIRADREKFDRDKYFELAKSKKVVAIGETGLEFHELKEKTDDEKEKIVKMQTENFLSHIDLACELDLPMIIHCREAYKEILDILTSEKKKYGKKLRGVMHSYLGRLTYAEEFNKLDFLIAFNGIVTYARDYDKVIKNVDLKYILTETDCPWLTPVPHRGERNEPVYVKFVAEKIAELKGIRFEEVAKTTKENAKRLFGI